jgi:1-deoxy-D-xylulose-5-phosphate synthase
MDQIIHDVALQNLPVVLCIERAGLVGEDGPTHHGSFDISLLRSIPNLVVAAPKNATELRCLMFTALQHKGPFVIRYPKAVVAKKPLLPLSKMAIGKGTPLQSGRSGWALMATGFFSNMAEEIGQLLPELSVYHFPFIKPLDHQLLMEIAAHHQNIITLEEGAVAGGFGSAIAQAPEIQGCKVWNLGLADQFVTHGNAKDLYAQQGLSTSKIVAWLQGLMVRV